MSGVIREDYVTEYDWNKHKYYNIANAKYMSAKKSLYYSEYQMENARWRMSWDVVSACCEDIELYKNSPKKTLFGLEIDICDGEGILQLYVEI